MHEYFVPCINFQKIDTFYLPSKTKGLHLADTSYN